MQNSGTSASSLAERVRAKAEQERQEMESLTRQQFSALSESLRQSSQNALSTTEAAILAQLGNLESSISSRSRTLHRAFGWACLRSLLLSLSILMGAGLSGWGLLTLVGNKTQVLRAEILELQQTKNDLEKTIASWPLKLNNAPNGRFIVPTPPHTLKENWTFENKPAWKLE